MIYAADKTTIHALKAMLYTLYDYSDNEYCSDNKADPEYGYGLLLADIEAHIAELEKTGKPKKQSRLQKVLNPLNRLVKA